MPRCKNCKTKFEVKYFNQKYCLKKAVCTIAFIEYAKEQKKKAWKKKKKVLKEQLKTRTDHLNDLQVIFNKYIRTRDKWEPCISCEGANKDTKRNAGHYYAVGSYPSLRFNEDNCHAQCEYCNSYLHGNFAEYTINLPYRIGLSVFGKLKKKRKEKLKLTLPEILELKVIYKRKIKDLE